MANDRESDDPSQRVFALQQQVEQLGEEERYREAILIATQARHLARKHLGPNHPVYAASLNNLAELYQRIGDYRAALPLFRQALRIRRVTLGKSHPDYATSLNNLGALYEDLGDHAAALPLYRQAMKIRRTALRSEPPGLRHQPG